MTNDESGRLLFGVDVAIFLGFILLLTYSVAVLAPESSENAGIKVEYAALSL